MKPGDKFAVNLNEHVVAEAVVIDIEDGKVTLDIPATRIVMGVKSSLTDLPDTAPEVERVLLDAPSAPQSNESAQPTPNTQAASFTVTNPAAVQTAQAVDQTVPAPAPAPVQSTVPPDAIGEGLAGVKLQEMD